MLQPKFSHLTVSLEKLLNLLKCVFSKSETCHIHQKLLEEAGFFSFFLSFFLSFFFLSSCLALLFFIYFYQLEANYFTILQQFLSYIDMNQPWIYMYSPSRSPLPPPSLPDLFKICKVILKYNPWQKFRKNIYTYIFQAG